MPGIQHGSDLAITGMVAAVAAGRRFDPVGESFKPSQSGQAVLITT